MDPITLALLGGGSTILGGLFGSSAQDKVDAARNQVIQDERARQAALSGEASGVNDQSLGRYNNFDTQQTAKAAQLADLFKTPVVTPNTALTTAPLPPIGSNQVQREVDNKTGIAQDYVDHQGDSLAKLRSFGDLFGGIQRGQARDAGQIGQLGDFKKGSTAVEQLELDNANRAGNGDKFFSDLLGGLGKVGLTAGLSGALAPIAGLTAAGGISGAVGPTSVGGAALVGAGTAPSSIFATGGSPFLNYGRA